MRNRVFHAYLELYFQGKHDQAIRDYCATHRIETRKQKDTQVDRKRTDTTFGYYMDKAETAIDRVVTEMEDKWSNNTTNNGVFVKGEKNIMAVQGETLNGDSYDISHWYDGVDVYVSFHCYPN